MQYPKAYLEFLIYFHTDRDYFECHEVLEEHWKTTPRQKEDQYWVALIQLAVGLYHERRGNIPGAKRMLSSSLRIIDNDPLAFNMLGLNTPKLIKLINERLIQIEQSASFLDMDLPIDDPQLLKECYSACEDKKLVWCAPSMLDRGELVHKHSRRDRSEVIAERALQLKKRRDSKQNPLDN
ncbi:DUF309 domain-containing protein [Alkalihalobacillus sp. NPDC078783]